MIPFETTPEQVSRLWRIVTAMGKARLSPEFRFTAEKIARVDQGVFDLMEMWMTADKENRAEIVAEIKKSISDYEN